VDIGFLQVFFILSDELALSSAGVVVELDVLVAAIIIVHGLKHLHGLSDPTDHQLQFVNLVALGNVLELYFLR
jgi:hypothetical protein